ncbi:MAG: hypothetical protein LJE94_17140 [Deltaproteobacteria bacterium]|nr:hypothetical protein [Deltaproteobacteria bacterium]
MAAASLSQVHRAVLRQA